MRQWTLMRINQMPTLKLAFDWFSSRSIATHLLVTQGMTAKPLSGHGFIFLNTLRPRQNGCHFADNIFKCIFLNENVWISIKISLNFVPRGPIKDIPALVQIMAWRCPGAKPLSEPMMVSFLTHICVTRPQWVNWRLSVIFKHPPWP